MSQKSNSTTPSREQRKAQAKAVAVAAENAARRRQLITRIAVVAAIAAVLGGLFAIYRSSNDSSTGASGGSGKYVYQVGKPGAGDQAIDFSLPSTAGGSMGLADFKGKTVLTYWHEGLGCQPCWDQIAQIEQDPAKLKAAGIDEFVSITSGPLDALQQKMADDDLSSVTLADSDLAVSRKYEMNQFGMMGDSRDGHTFLLIGPDGKILWRADYGGAPNYTMFVPVETLLTQLKAGRQS
ncbi:MAG: peroxiredoxin family protein [Acidimicrobiales bacterium]